MGVLGAIVVFIFSVIVLVKSSEVFVKNLVAIARFLRLPEFFFGFLLVGLGTSLPELFVGLNSVADGIPIIALGNTLGASFVDITVIFAVTILLFKGIPTTKVVKEDIAFPLIGMLAPLIFLLDGKLSRSDGFSNIIIFFILAYWLIRTGRHKAIEDHISLKSYFLGFFFLLTSLAGIILSSHFAVAATEQIIAAFQFSSFVFTALILGLGTTMPELTLAIAARKFRKTTIALGDVFGSVTVNTNLILGLVALLSPIQLQTANLLLLLPFLLLSMGAIIVWLLASKRLTPVLAILLLVIYLSFFGLSVLQLR